MLPAGPSGPATKDWDVIASPELYEQGHGREVFARLRADKPVGWTSTANGSGFWSVIRHRDIVTVSKKTDTFSSARDWGGHRIYDETDDPLIQKIDANLLSMDPPEHTKHRAVMAPALSADRVRAMEESLRAVVTELFDRVAPHGRCDFVESFAAALPTRVLAQVLGSSEEDTSRLLEWSNAFAFDEDPNLRRSPEHLLQCALELREFAIKQWRDKLRRPKEDLISMWVHSSVDGEPMPIPRFLAMLALLVIAGNDTVKNSISGGLVALAEHPEQRRRLIEQPALIPQAAREIVRWVSPVLHMRRTATDDTELAGQAIKKGDKVVVWYISGNHDEDVYPAADRFDVTRTGPALIAFGAGPHVCIGRRLAEMQLTTFLGELLRRMPDVEPDGPIVRVRSNFLNGIRSMPVRFKAT